MIGGVISVNTASWGGGVCAIDAIGQAPMRFTKTGGTICGNTSAPAWNRSTGSQGGHTVYILSSYNPSTIPYTPVRGKYRDTTAGPSDSIDTNDGTGLFD